MSELQKLLRSVASQTLKPKPRLNLREWADEYRRLSQESAAEPGRWRTSRVPYMAEPMEVISQNDTSRIVLMISSQLGKTEFLLNVFGYYAHLEPSPILLIQPTEGAASAFSKDRIAPMIRDTPVITDLFKSDAYGDSANTILHKSYPGGYIALAGSNAPQALAGRPIRIILLDEIDRFPTSAKTEGDPVDIVKRRCQNFPDSKFIAVSTPTIEGESKIAALYEDTDQRKYHIACVHCSELFYPEWKHIAWTTPEDAQIYCPHCGGGHNDHERLQASYNGRWIASNPGHRTPGFHTNALVSPWTKLTEMVYEFVQAENKPNKLQPFYNTILGLPYKYVGSVVGDISISQRSEDYNRLRIPNDVVILTAGCDVQGDRIEAEVIGHTTDGRIYNIDYIIVQGDTKDLSTFREFRDTLMNTDYFREDGIQLEVLSTLIDAGYNTKVVYEFTNQHKKDRIYASRGISGPVSMLVHSQSKFNASFYKVGVDIFKEQLYNQLLIDDPSKEGYCHFPKERTLDYFAQLCQSETRTLVVDKRGRQYWHYQNDEKKRNEALDCRVYAMAAYELIRNVTKKNAEYSIKKQIKHKIEHINKEVPEDITPTEVIPHPIPKPSKYASWTQGYNK